MAASAPLIVRADTVTALAVPTFLSANAPVAPVVLNVTSSPLTVPVRLALPTLRLAVVVPS